MDRRRFLFTVAGATLGLVVNARAGAGLSVAEAINKAGRQRMLSQRCAKAWLMTALGVMPEKAPQWLEASAALFDRQMAELQTLQPNARIQSHLVQLSADWHGYREVLRRSPERANAAALFERNEIVLASAHATTQAYEALAGTRGGRLINLSGRQRMLSQRMAKFVYFQRLGVEGKAASAGLAKARDEFLAAMKALNAAGENTARIQDELALADQQWFFFQAALDDGRSKDAMRAIATTSERILEQLNLVVGLYEQLMTASAS